MVNRKSGPVRTSRDGGFDDLFRELPSVMRSARLIVGDAELARDSTQDAFTKLFVHWKRVSAYDSPGAWVRREACRGCSRPVFGDSISMQLVPLRLPNGP